MGFRLFFTCSIVTRLCFCVYVCMYVYVHAQKGGDRGRCTPLTSLQTYLQNQRLSWAPPISSRQRRYTLQTATAVPTPYPTGEYEKSTHTSSARRKGAVLPGCAVAEGAGARVGVGADVDEVVVHGVGEGEELAWGMVVVVCACLCGSG
jgi:hypothetical protein